MAAGPRPPSVAVLEKAPAATSLRTVGRYALYDLIAAGGMGAVHYGRFAGPAGFARTVAVKMLHPQLAREVEFVGMLADEARLASRIRHPNVIPTLDVVEDPEGFFVIMDYVHGESLARLLETAQQLGCRPPPPVVAAILIGALRGLHAAHEATSESGVPLGIIHRDVSPQNILVGADGQTRVLDFGVAKATVRLTSSREGQLKGKLAYMSPEQLHGEAVDRRSDVYAASVVLWEALTGTRLFTANSEGELLHKILRGVTRGPSFATGMATTVDAASMKAMEDLDAVVLRGLATDPSARFSTAREMAVALEEATKVATVGAVEEWVEAIAGPLLKQRAAIVRRIESLSEPTALTPPAVPRVDPAQATAVVTSPIASRVESVARRKLRPGAVAPEIDATTTTGKRFVLSASTRLCTVVYFFPKAFTSACTAQTKLFQSNHVELSLAGADVLGISTDDVDTQCAFAASMALSFPMVADADLTICRAYDVLWPLVRLAQRVTFVIGPGRRVLARFRHEPRPAAHVKDVQAFVDELHRARASGR